MKHVAIIGNGITGISAATQIRKMSDCRITVISAETEHFYSRTALMYIYMGHLNYEDTRPYEDWFWEKNRIDLMFEYVTKIDADNKNLFLQSGNQLSYDALIIATGSHSNRFGWLGQYLKGVQGLYSYQDLQLLEHNSRDLKKAVIVGGGLIGIELTEMLMSRNIPITFLVREKYFWDIVFPDEEAKLIGDHIRAHHVDLRLETELKEILADDSGRVKAVVTDKGEEIACQFVGLTVGVHPNIEVAKNSDIETDRGVLVDEYLQTNIPDVYAGGDCAQFRTPLPGRRPIEQVWYTGKIHGETIARNICQEKATYNPGIWFNSAKFMDIEYQTYGMVPNQLPADQDTFYWEHADRQKSMRINYSKRDRVVTGFNFLGIRARHNICETWIAEKRTIEYVLANLGALNFDPEFFALFEKQAIHAYNAQNSANPVTLATKKGLFSKFFRV